MDKGAANERHDPEPVLDRPVAHNIERALIAAGKDLDRLAPADLGLLEDFHTMGRIATAQLVDLAGISSQGARCRQRFGAPPASSPTAMAAPFTPWTSPRNTATRAVGSMGWSDWAIGYPFNRRMSPNSRSPTAFSTS